MRKDVSRPTPAFSNFESLLGKSQSSVVILVVLALALVSPQFAFGQMTQQQQQEEQQREEQQREEQQREEQAREQQQREEQQRQEQQREEQQRQEQQREEQQREEQEREQQAREEQQREQQEQQQREQQAREQQAREQQAREQQAREQQAREQQAREQQQQDDERREKQERQQQQQTTGTPVDSSTGAAPSANSHLTGTIPAGSQVSNDSRHTATPTQALAPDGRTNAAASEREKKVPNGQDSRLPASDPPHRPCDKEPCPEPGPKPVPQDLRAKLCKDGPCPVCAPGQSPGKDNSCVSSLEKEASTAPKPSVVPQSCPAGQIWNGVQCATVGPQQCLPGQANVGGFCQTDCTSAAAGAQSFIELLRMARQDQDQACAQNPTGDECRSKETTYDMRLNEYRNYLGGVPTGCALPDPISI